MGGRIYDENMGDIGAGCDGGADPCFKYSGKCIIIGRMVGGGEGGRGSKMFCAVVVAEGLMHMRWRAEGKINRARLE